MSYLKPILLIVALFIVGWIFYQPETRANLLQVASWAETNQLVAAPLFVAFLILAIVIMFPIWGVLMISGYLFGPVFGFMLAWLGFQIGVYISFLFARTIGRDWVKTRFSSNPKFRRFEERIEKSGFMVVLLARASIIFPTNILNLLSGICSISARKFISANAIGAIPLVGLYTFLGAQSSNLIASISDGSFHPPEISLQTIGFVLLIVLALVALFYFKSKRKAL